MNGLLHAAWEVEQFMRQQKWCFCIIGGLAVIRWGQSRATQDVDVSLLTSFGREAEYANRILEHFPGRIPDAKQFALNNRVLLARTISGVPLDIALAAFPYEEKVIARASEFAYAKDVSITTASAEDMVVMKAFAGREQDWFDVKGILARQRNRLDWNYILAELTALGELKDDSDPLQRLRELRYEVEG